MADYIPAGRTSRTMYGRVELQIQTEYAFRPGPRLTTSIFSKGQIIHKIEQELPQPITSIEDKSKVETLLLRQHKQVMEIIGSDEFEDILRNRLPAKDLPPPRPKSLPERLKSIGGVAGIYAIDNDGNFLNPHITSGFKRQFKAVFKHLHELLSVFTELPGGRREDGVYEVERDRLYLVSTGSGCFFVLTTPADGVNYEKALASTLK
ncbi:MAG: hypothetical protein JW763_03145 [candidate division Zixibacteria bacterium]|nr:hypothetical protein [candidate division Zixibacteria bacterium]